MTDMTIAPTAPTDPLAQTWDAMEAARGRRWAYDSLIPARAALVTFEPTPRALRETPKAQPIVAKINWLAETLRAAGGRVCWSVYGGDEGPRVGDVLGEEARAKRGQEARAAPTARLSPEMQVGLRDLTYTRKGYSAFFQGACHLSYILKSYDVETLILAGFSTNIEVDANARDAMATGYRVIVAADACGSANMDLHWASLRSLHMAFGDVRLAQDVATMIRKG